MYARRLGVSPCSVGFLIRPDGDFLWEHLDALLLHGDPRIMHLPVDGLEVEDAVQVRPDGRQLVLGLPDLVRLVVLQDVRLDLEHPALLGVHGDELAPGR